MLADSHASNQLDPVLEDREEEKEVAENEKEVEQRVPATIMTPGAPLVPVVKKKYPVVLLYVRGISEQLRRVFRSFDIPAYFKPNNTLRQLLVHPKDSVEKGKVVGPIHHISYDDCGATLCG